MWRESRVLVVPADHRFASRDSISILETAKEHFVAASGGAPESVDWWIVDPRPDGSRPLRGPTADSVEGLLELVAAGAGVNIAGESAGRHYRRDEVAYIPITDIEPATIVLCSASDAHNPVVPAFRETAKSLSPLVEGSLY
jgi:DNA-binding transcriptional LysR family regulator